MIRVITRFLHFASSQIMTYWTAKLRADGAACSVSAVILHSACTSHGMLAESLFFPARPVP